MEYKLTYKSFGDRAVLIEWSPKMDESILSDIISFRAKVLSEGIVGVKEIIQSINSITVLFDIDVITYVELVSLLKKLRVKNSSVELSTKTLWHIPVCYDESFGLDLADLSKQKGLSKDEIIKLHSQRKYKVYSIGFLPGFLYLGGLDEKLCTPRRPEPRLEVLKGSVGIGGEQTGIYPIASPGGWQIIGNTPITLFDVNKEVPCFMNPGDEIRFTPISPIDLKLIIQLISAGEYEIDKEVVRD